MKKNTIILLLFAFVTSLLLSCDSAPKDPKLSVQHTNADSQWSFGFGSSQIIAPGYEDGTGLIIAGYHNGMPADRCLNAPEADYAQARALWLGTGNSGILLIGIDCIALSSATVKSIRERLQPVVENANCIHISVYATHTHAQADTLGLWGDPAMDGKNAAYMEALEKAAEDATTQAISSLRTGDGYWGSIDASHLLSDSRYPHVFDSNLYQIRFSSKEGSGVRLLFYGAHAESLRGDNRQLSRDFPGMLCDLVTEANGDDAMFFPGAIGGLIMTKVLSEPFDAKENMTLTANALADCVLSIDPAQEMTISPQLTVGTAEFTIPMENSLFLVYKFLGILDSTVEQVGLSSDYVLCTELNILRIGDLTIALLPGEIFPELVFGGEYGYAGDGFNPKPLCDIARSYGCDNLLIAGLANDEIGYIVPPSDFLLNPQNPYVEGVVDYKNENHYEETNSLGPETANRLAEVFEALLSAISSN